MLESTTSGQQAYEELSHAIEVISTDSMRLITLNPQHVSVFVVNICGHLESPELRAALLRMPEEFFDASSIDRLPKLVLALRYVDTQRQRAATGKQTVPHELLSDGFALKKKMLRLCTYLLEDNPVDAAEISSIRLGTGYLDLVSDLNRLANLYSEREAILKQDNVNYRPEDLGLARRLSASIMTELANTADERAWADRSMRLLNLIEQTYDEVAATATYIFRRDARSKFFPTFYVGARK